MVSTEKQQKQMHIRERSAFLILAVTCWGMGWSVDTARAQDSSKMSSRLACRTVKNLLPEARIDLDEVVEPDRYRADFAVIGAHLTLSGIAFERPNKRDLEIAYKDMKGATQSSDRCVQLQTKGHITLCVMFKLPVQLQVQPQKGKKIVPTPLELAVSEAHAAQLARALNQLITDAHKERPFICSDDPHDYSTELASFERETAAWRAMPTKPALSDEVYKDRLLAEDALKNKDLNGALRYYEAGVAADPTWAQGWYNAALLYTEQKDYFDAAHCMKHYVILVPDASDAQTAKDNIILWEAKAQRAKP